MTLTSGPLTTFGLLFPVVCFIFVWPSFIGAVMSMIKGGYAIPAAEQELGRPFTVGHDRGWSATVRHVRPWSATQVAHGRSRSAMNMTLENIQHFLYFMVETLNELLARKMTKSGKGVFPPPNPMF